MKLHQRAWAAEQRARLDHVDVRPARAAQRLVQHRRARRRGRGVPRRLLRADRRRHQRRRRERPPARRLGRRRRRRPAGRRADAGGRSPCRRPTTSSCCGAPIPAGRRSALAPTGGSRDGARRPTLAARRPRSPAFTRDAASYRRRWRVTAREPERAIRELREIRLPLVTPFRTSFGVQTSRRILLVRAEVEHDGDASPRAGASASPATSRRTRPSTSTAPRS